MLLSSFSTLVQAVGDVAPISIGTCCTHHMGGVTSGWSYRLVFDTQEVVADRPCDLPEESTPCGLPRPNPRKSARRDARAQFRLGNRNEYQRLNLPICDVECKSSRLARRRHRRKTRKATSARIMKCPGTECTTCVKLLRVNHV